MEIKNSVFVVSGGASGLGAATVRMLAGAGAAVVIADVSVEPGEKLASELGAKVRFVRTDVTDADSAQNAITTAVDAFGALHGLVNCAGIAPGEKVVGRNGPHKLESFARAININLIGVFNMIRLAAEAMIRNVPNSEGERGVLISTASVAAFEGQIGQAAYAASKAGVVGLTLPIAREMATHGIRVMAIAPGIFETPMMAGMSQEVQDSLGRTVPFPSRMGRPSEYAQLVKSIVENPMLNGETIRLDGAIRMTAK